MRGTTISGTGVTLALLLLLISPALSVSIGAGAQPVELFHDNQGYARISALYASEQQQPQSAKVVVLDSASAKNIEGALTTSTSSAEAEISQIIQLLPPTSTEGGDLILFLQQNGQTGIIVRATDAVSELPALQVSTQLARAWSDTSRRRSRFGIVVQILDVLKEGPMTPYELGFRLRLNDKRAKAYLDMLEKKELVEISSKDGRTSYELTASGRTFAEGLKKALEVNEGSTIRDRRTVFSDLL